MGLLVWCHQEVSFNNYCALPRLQGLACILGDTVGNQTPNLYLNSQNYPANKAYDIHLYQSKVILCKMKVHCPDATIS